MTHPDTIKKEQLERILTEWSGKTISDNSHFVSELKKTVESAIDATREATLLEVEEVYYNKNPHHLSLAEIIKQMKNK